MYLLALVLDYNIKAFDNQLRIPFDETDEELALDKAYDILEIWQDRVVSARLFELVEVGEFNLNNRGRDDECQAESIRDDCGNSGASSRSTSKG